MRKSALFALLAILCCASLRAQAWDPPPGDRAKVKNKAAIKPIAPEDSGAAMRAWNVPPDPFVLMFLMGQGNDGQDPDNPDWDNPPHPKGKGKQEAEPFRGPAPGPSVVATTPAGVIFFIAGTIGWIALGVSVLVLERRQVTSIPAKAPTDDAKQLPAEGAPSRRPTESPAKRMEAMVERASRLQASLNGEKRAKLDAAVKDAKGAVAVGDGAKIDLALDRLADMLFDLERERK